MIPMFRAVRARDGVLVKGNLINIGNYRYVMRNNYAKKLDDIKIKTLEISFDGGKTFDDVNEVKRAVEFVKGQAEIWNTDIFQ